jgi:hypothetical protein
MTVKMVVPMLGALEMSAGVEVAWFMGSKLVVVDMAVHGLGDQRGGQAVA